ncbi:hypothetical protein JTE90_019403 [Oedothorax gibbosus]|uniref:Homeobox domain-containing protein n=1 Tax=Oedothorax gibbosus TaxID=931172 RepID=A0AAV6TTC4_9ARAC|nr:hypothetical protein JTE90_019403 [Oedothorax gibbosus]
MEWQQKVRCVSLEVYNWEDILDQIEKADFSNYSIFTMSSTRKSSGDRTSSGSKRRNFSEGQTAVLKGWLNANLGHPYPTESEKLVLARKADLSKNQVNDYYTNARRRTYLKMCEERGIVPVKRKQNSKSSTSDGEKENDYSVALILLSLNSNFNLINS